MGSYSFKDLDAWLDHGPVIAAMNPTGCDWGAPTPCRLTNHMCFAHFIVLTHKIDVDYYGVSNPITCNWEERFATKADIGACAIRMALRPSCRKAVARRPSS